MPRVVWTVSWMWRARAGGLAAGWGVAEDKGVGSGMVLSYPSSGRGGRRKLLLPVAGGEWKALS